MHALRPRVAPPSRTPLRLSTRPRTLLPRSAPATHAPPAATPTPLTLDPAISAAEQEVEAATGGQHYDWAKGWYPVACLDSLPTDRPTRVALLGRDLAVFYDGNRWAAFADRW